ncbi:MAG: ThuA domain-containing protein [Verrucomicrobiota bacterium]
MLHRDVRSFIVLVAGLLLLSHPTSAAEPAVPQKLIRALLITGGCCHNYEFQSKALMEGVARHATVEWKIVHEGGTGTKAMIPLYDDPNWAKGYDVVIHNECFADTKDPVYIRKITSAHKAGVPAVVIHCAMHSYRAAEIDDWREFLGVTSRRHEHQGRYAVRKVQTQHPILKGFPDNWVTPPDELYVIEKLWPTARALAVSLSEVDGKAHPVAWINQYGNARVFGTTYGHSDATFGDKAFTDLLARGMLWVLGRYDEK